MEWFRCWIITKWTSIIFHNKKFTTSNYIQSNINQFHFVRKCWTKYIGDRGSDIHYVRSFRRIIYLFIASTKRMMHCEITSKMHMIKMLVRRNYHFLQSHLGILQLLLVKIRDLFSHLDFLRRMASNSMTVRFPKHKYGASITHRIITIQCCSRVWSNKSRFNWKKKEKVTVCDPSNGNVDAKCK